MTKPQSGARSTRVWRVLLPLLFLITVFLIFANSADSGAISGGKSAAVMRAANGFLAWVGVSFRFTEHLIRKLAHFAEYALLGFLALLNLRVYSRRIAPYLAWPLLICLLTAVADESFQLTVPGRSGQVSDVLIDFAGVAAGHLIGWLTCALATKMRRHKR